MGLVFKNIEYMNGGCFENLSGTSVPKSIGRGPPGARPHLSMDLFQISLNDAYAFKVHLSYVTNYNIQLTLID
jgi:hypothetical protein